MSRNLRVGGAIAALLGLMGTGLVTGAGANALVNPAPVGNGFTVTAGDISFILKQIKIAERHSQAIEHTGTTPLPSNPDPAGDPEYCSSLIGPAANQIPDYLTSYGLRTVDGGCNNLVPSALLNPDGTTVHNAQTGAVVTKYQSAQADVPFPRLTSPDFRPAEAGTSYAQKTTGNTVIDTQPRLISNLIVDQTSTNPAAVAAAGFPVRTQGNTGIQPCTTDPDNTVSPPVVGVPAGCTPSHQTLFIPNVTTDVGLSPPYNSLFTFFGQFFDHGVDQTVKSGGTVIVPLRADDPLIAGPDHILGNADDLKPELRFMALTRAQNQPGPDGVLGTADDVTDANNTDTPWVDQSQTYTSHSSHQIFLREYDMQNVGPGGISVPVATGKLLGGIVTDDALPCTKTGGVPCWNDGN
ncbi:MAG TPA: hypothetical protein VGC84_00880, partial [Ilumatobacteraceae bacterium]